jgi:hypothetical protein
VLQNGVLRKIFGTKNEEVTGECMELHDELHKSYSSANIITVITSRSITQTGHVAQ